MAGPWEKYRAPQSIPVGPQDPTYPFKAQQAQTWIQAQQSNMANDVVSRQRTQQQMRLDAQRLALEQQKAENDRRASAEERLKDEEQKKIFARDAISGLRMIDRIESDINDTSALPRMIGGRGFGETGALGSFLSNFPGTAAHDLRTNVGKVKGLSILNKLIEAKNAMPKGAQGLFGATNESELRALASALSTLDPNDSTGNFSTNLKDSRNAFLSVLRGVNPKAADAYEKARQQYKSGGLRNAPRKPRQPNVIDFNEWKD